LFKKIYGVIVLNLVGAAPIGFLLGGSFGVWTGSSLVLALSGVTVFLVALYWFYNQEVRNLPATTDLDENSLQHQPTNRSSVIV